MSLNGKLSSMVIIYNLQTNLFKMKKNSYVDKFYDKVNLEPVTFPLIIWSAPILTLHVPFINGDQLCTVFVTCL